MLWMYIDIRIAPEERAVSPLCVIVFTPLPKLRQPRISVPKQLCMSGAKEQNRNAPIRATPSSHVADVLANFSDANIDRKIIHCGAPEYFSQQFSGDVGHFKPHR